MSLKSEINTLIGDIITDECKEKPELYDLIELFLQREMRSLTSRPTDAKIISDYDGIVSRFIKDKGV